MRMKTEIAWLAFCILFGILLYFVAEWALPGPILSKSGELIEPEKGSYFYQLLAEYYLFPAPQILVLFLNFALLGLKMLAGIGAAFRLPGIIFTAIIGTITGAAALLLANEYFFYTDEKVTVEHIYILPMVLLTGIAIMAFVRTREIVDVRGSQK